MKMKTFLIVLTAVTSVSAFAQGDVVSGVKAVDRHFREHPVQRGAVVSTVECGVGIAISANPAGAAAVGLPILGLGNLSAFLLSKSHPVEHAQTVDVASAFHNIYGYAQRHPSTLQNFAGSFCLSYGLARAGHHVSKPTAQPKTPTKTPEPSQPTPPSPTQPPADPKPPVDPPAPNPPPQPPQPPVTPPVKGCVQDCGFPGNGGVNGGSDTGKPPFPGKGPSKP